MGCRQSKMSKHLVLDKRTDNDTQRRTNIDNSVTESSSTADNISQESKSNDFSRDFKPEDYDEGLITPPKPPLKRRRDIITNPNQFERIDDYALGTPASECDSIENLARYLTRPAKSSLEKIRAIHTWITANIRYDVDALGGQNVKKSCNAMEVLRNRCCVCSGYSNLFAELCRCASVPAKVINGFGKGYDHELDMEFDLKTSSPNHSWNAVFMEGEWGLIDCTWDAGHYDNLSFRCHKQENYFFVDPEIFISSHFPFMDEDLASSNSWQLLDKPVNLEAFSKQLKLDTGAISNGINPLSHKETTVYSNGETCIEIQRQSGPIEELSFTFKLLEENTDFSNSIVAQRTGNNIVKIHIYPPAVNKYTLSLFVLSSINGKDMDHVFSYLVICSKTSIHIDNLSFPSHKSLYGPLSHYKEFGFDSAIEKYSVISTEREELNIDIPVLNKVDIITTLDSADNQRIDKAVFVQECEASVQLSVRFPKRGNYKLTVFGTRVTNKTYEVVAVFLTCCNGTPTAFQEFPLIFDNTNEFHVHLIEPMTRVLPAGSTVRFRFSSPILQVVQLGIKTYRKPDSKLWEIDVETPEICSDFYMFGSKDVSGCLHGIYGFIISDDPSLKTR